LGAPGGYGRRDVGGNLFNQKRFPLCFYDPYVKGYRESMLSFSGDNQEKSACTTGGGAEPWVKD
jgi:hypothetical protein